MVDTANGARMAKPQRIGLVFEHDMAYPRGVLRGIKQFAQTKPNWILVMLEPEALSAQALEVMRPAGVIANAVASALGDFGVEPHTLPLSPQRVWELIRDASEP